MVEEIMRLAELRNGLGTRAQYRKHGLSPGQIDRARHKGLLVDVFRNVYLVAGLTLDEERAAIAACLAAPQAIVSHNSAAQHYGLRRSLRGQLELTIGHHAKVRMPGVLLHRSNHLAEHDVLHHINGLRVTSPARTVFDQASVLDRAALRSLVHDALNRKLVTSEELHEVGGRLGGRGRAGTTAFRELLADLIAAAPPAGSDGELVLAHALVDAGLPPPVRQYRIRLGNGVSIQVDLAWPEVRLAVEVDHSFWHAGPVAVQRDKARDNQLALLGWECRRFTEDDVGQRLVSTVALIRAVHSMRSLAA